MFSFENPLRQAAVTFTVTPLTGDPDIFVSTLSTVDRNNYMWASTNAGADIVAIDYTDADYIMGTYYVSVYAFSESSFSVLASLHDLSGVDTSVGTVTTLLDGVPQAGLMQGGQMQFFSFAFGSGDLTITVTPQYGDPDLYVTVDGTMPSVDNFQWASLDWGRDTLLISSPCFNCIVLIGVEAFEHTLYSVVASSDSAATFLQLGVPMQGFVAESEYSYFRVAVPSSLQDLTISLTCISGDGDLYISQDYNRPDESFYTWKVAAFGSDVFVLSSPPLGDYFIGVYGYSASSFVLTASQGATSLIPGQPHADFVDSGATRLFEFVVSNDPGTITLSLQFAYGEAAIYVTTGNVVPSPLQFTWSSSTVSPFDRRNTLSIMQDDPNACVNCVYRVAVVGRSQADFTITLSVDARTTLLLNGRPWVGSGAQGSTQYFYALVDSSSADVSIDATLFLGDASMFVSTSSTTPGPTNFMWRDVDGSRGLHVSLQHSELTLGNYFIALNFQTDCQFSLTFSTDGAMLVDGNPSVVTIPQAGNSRFWFFLPTLADIRLDLLGSFSGSMDVYVSRDTDPDASNFQWYKRLANGGHMIIVGADPLFCSDCVYYVNVVGSAGVQFQILLTSAADFAVVMHEQFVYGVVASGSMSYYETFVAAGTGFEVLLETCTGNADMYMSQETYRPSVRQSTWNSAQYNTVDRIVVRDPSLASSGFYIGVYGAVTDPSDFRLLVKTVDDSQGEHRSPIVSNNRLSVDTSTGGQIAISFSSASSPIDVSLSYFAFYALNEDTTAMYSPCGLERCIRSAPVAHDPAQDTHTVILTLADGLQTGLSYKVNVAVFDVYGEQALYEWHGSVTVASSGGLPESVVLWAILLVAVVLVIVVCVVIFTVSFSFIWL